MCCHIVWALVGMDEKGVTVGDQTRQVGIEVPQDVGVGILVDDQRCARVVDKDVAQTLANTALSDGSLHLTGDLLKRPPRCRDFKRVVSNHSSPRSVVRCNGLPRAGIRVNDGDMHHATTTPAILPNAAPDGKAFVAGTTMSRATQQKLSTVGASH